MLRLALSGISMKVGWKVREMSGKIFGQFGGKPDEIVERELWYVCFNKTLTFRVLFSLIKSTLLTMAFCRLSQALLCTSNIYFTSTENQHISKADIFPASPT